MERHCLACTSVATHGPRVHGTVRTGGTPHGPASTYGMHLGMQLLVATVHPFLSISSLEVEQARRRLCL